MIPSFLQASILAAALNLLASAPLLAEEEVNVYSNRPAELVQPLLDAFTRQTGITANFLYLDTGLIERIRSEGEYSPADVILASDDSRLAEIQAAGITQALNDSILDREVPANYRDPAGHWFGLTVRPRIFYVSSERVAAKAITYEELSQPKWRGKVCLRDGHHAANIGLFAFLLAAHGEAYTETWLKGLKANLARKPRGSDRSQAEAVAAGICHLAIGNAEYYAGMMADPAQREAVKKIRVVFPNADGRGASAGLSGMALARHSPNRNNAVKLMEFLLSEPAQELYSRETNEYPVLPGAEPSSVLESFGAMKAADMPMSEISALRTRALELVDKVEFNQGPAN